MSRVVPYATAGERAAAREEVGAHVAAGGVVAYPTETVYGLGTGLVPEGLEALAGFKGDRPFLLLVRGPEDAPGLEWTVAAARLADAFWPGPLTLALTAAAGAYPEQVVGPDGAVAVRVSPHAAVRSLLEAAGGPVTSTSANRPGGAAARSGAEAARVAASVEAEVLVLDGGLLPEARPSTIVRCGEAVRLIREGAVPRAELEAVVTLT